MHFDILIAGDFRFPGGTSTAIAHELRALRSTTRSIGLYHVNSAYLSAKRIAWHRDIVAEVERGGLHVLAEDAAAEASVIFVHSPWILPQMVPTRLRAPLRILVAHHPPVDARGRLYYDPWAVERHARRAFGGPFVWAPISPVCRDAFDTASLTFPRLKMDWTNLIFVEDWGTARAGLIGDRPAIGRHSQPRAAKWPATRETLFQVYPNGDDVQVHLMGLAERTKAMIDKYPSNWHIMERDEIPVPDFLSRIDFFIYFHHHDWLEAYGRTVAEAAAAGCVVILPWYLQRTFGEAALYCEPAEALNLVHSVAGDPERFAGLSSRGREIIDERFGPNRYLARLEDVMRAAEGKVSIGEIVEYRRHGPVKILRGHVGRASFHWHAIIKTQPKLNLKRRFKKLRREGFNRTRGFGS